MQKYFVITKEMSRIEYVKSIHDITQQWQNVNVNIINEQEQIIRGNDNIFVEKYIEKNTLYKKIFWAKDNNDAQENKSENCVELKNLKTKEMLINKF